MGTQRGPDAGAATGARWACHVGFQSTGRRIRPAAQGPEEDVGRTARYVDAGAAGVSGAGPRGSFPPEPPPARPGEAGSSARSLLQLSLKDPVLSAAR